MSESFAHEWVARAHPHVNSREAETLHKIKAYAKFTQPSGIA